MFCFELNKHMKNETNMFPTAKQVQLEINFFIQGHQFYHNRTNFHLRCSMAMVFIMFPNYRDLGRQFSTIIQLRSNLMRPQLKHNKYQLMAKKIESV